MSLGNHLIASWCARGLARAHTSSQPTHAFQNLALVRRMTDPTGGQRSWHCAICPPQKAPLYLHLHLISLTWPRCGARWHPAKRVLMGNWYAIGVVFTPGAIHYGSVRLPTPAVIDCRDMYGRSALEVMGGGVTAQWGVIEAWHGGNGVFTDMAADIAIIPPILGLPLTNIHFGRLVARLLVDRGWLKLFSVNVTATSASTAAKKIWSVDKHCAKARTIKETFAAEFFQLPCRGGKWKQPLRRRSWNTRSYADGKISISTDRTLIR